MNAFPPPAALAPKGRILQECGPLLRRAGLEPAAEYADEGSRHLRFRTEDPGLDAVRVRPFDVATFVAQGAAQLGEDLWFPDRRRVEPGRDGEEVGDGLLTLVSIDQRPQRRRRPACGRRQGGQEGGVDLARVRRAAVDLEPVAGGEQDDLDVRTPQLLQRRRQVELEVGAGGQLQQRQRSGAEGEADHHQAVDRRRGLPAGGGGADRHLNFLDRIALVRASNSD